MQPTHNPAAPPRRETSVLESLPDHTGQIGATVEGPLHQVQHFGPGNQVDLEIAAGIARLYDVIYGSRYISPLYSNPQRICTEINEGRWHAFVGFDVDGAVAGQVGLMIKADATLELGRDVVDPAARLRGSYKQLVRSREGFIDRIVKSGLHAVEYQWAESVTGHEGSQRTYKNTLGFVPCGVGALKYPDVFGRGQRESVVLMVKVVDPVIRHDRPVYVPGGIRFIVGEIFENLSCVRTFAPQPLIPAGIEQMQFAVRDKRAVGQIGFDFTPEPSDHAHHVVLIDDFVRQMRDEGGIHHFSARLNLQDPRTPALAQLLAADGFTFSHVEPRRSADILELQKLVGDEALDVKVIDQAMERMVRKIEETRRSIRH